MDGEPAEDYIAYRDARFGFDARRTAVWQAVVDSLRPWISGAGTVLDLGAGYGDLINNVDAPRRIAVDVADSTPFLESAIEFHRGDASDLAFLAEGTVDIVVASNLLEHLDRTHVSMLLKEAWRVLSDSGRIILIQPNFRLCADRYYDDYTHVTPFTDESLSGWLMSHGFTIERRRAGFLPFSMASRLPKSYLLTRFYLAIGSPLLAKQMLVIARKEQ